VKGNKSIGKGITIQGIKGDEEMNENKGNANKGKGRS
jgi:hypothetical protein